MSEKTIHNCIVIGAGASGLFFGASPFHLSGGVILEGNSQPGRKLLMSGSGQCNITHAGSIKDFVSCYNSSRIRSCLFRYNNDHLRDFLRKNGVDTIIREDGKVFPKSMKADDILQMLLHRCERNGFRILTSHKVTKITKSDSGLWSVICGNRRFTGKNLIIACGGCSYPSTGSDGSIFEILRRDLKPEITELRPALVPVAVKDYPYGELSGISFPDASVRILDGDTGVCRDKTCGPVLLTHRDFSGPAVLNTSKNARIGDLLEINYAGRSGDYIHSELSRARHGSSRTMASDISSVTGFPMRFCKSLESRFGNSVNKICDAICKEKFTITGGPGFKKAMATSGGVSLNELNLKTFESKTLEGLFIIGETCDIDGITGGYNLQFAYSSAFASAEYIASD